MFNKYHEKGVIPRYKHCKPLNPIVAEKLRNDPTLYMVFVLRGGADYDDEIDPLHNSSWVKQQREVEVKILNEAEEIVRELLFRHGKVYGET